MSKIRTRLERHLKKHKRVRRTIQGTAQRPRLCVYRSLAQIYAQVIDDNAGQTLVSASSLDKEFRSGNGKGSNRDGARQVGLLLAKRAQEKGVQEVIFDRGGFLYHGRVKSLAEGAREGGLKF